MRAEIGVLLVNVGTPDSPKVKDVRKYLLEFLSDPRVIEIPAIARYFLVNFIIVPFRAPKSAKIYRELWTENGSPIIIYGESVRRELQNELGDNYQVELAMRYQNPNINDVLEQMGKSNYKKVMVIPLFPQYASATTGSVVENVFKIISEWAVIPETKIINQFYDDENFLNAIVEISKKYNINEFDHIIFSYHGLPLRQLDYVHKSGKMCDELNCENEINEENKFCYKATCYATTRLLTAKLNIPKEKYTVAFQSRLNRKWLEPFTDKIIIDMAEKGAKKILIFSPAFVADCLETTIEIGVEYQQLFKKYGGEKIQLVESLNDHPLWVNSLKEMVLANG